MPEKRNEFADERGNVLVMLERVQSENGGEAAGLRGIERRSLGCLPFPAGSGEEVVLLDNRISAALFDQVTDFAGCGTEIQDGT